MENNVENPVVGINIYKKVFDAKYFLSELENECQKSNPKVFWENSGVGSGQVGSYRTSMSCNLQEIMVPNSKKDIEGLFLDNVHNKIKNCIEDYSQIYELGGIHEAFQVLKYTSGCNYRAHFDDGPGIRRTYSLVSILQAPESGGELEFPLFNFTYKPENGDVVFFPANYPYLHIAHPVTSGVKYSMVTWFP